MKQLYRVRFLGSGSAFTLGGNYHSNILIENETGRNFLFDCGTDVRFSLYEQGMSYADIDSVYISHLHADHCGGLEWLGLSHKFDPRLQKPQLFVHRELVEALWEHRLKGGMQTLPDEEANLKSFFDVNDFDNGFIWEAIEFHAVPTKHVCNYTKPLPSFGLQFRIADTNILITADAQFVPDMMPYYETADIIFHDCETTRIPSGVHAHYDELKTLPTNIKQKMWLYHYNPGVLPNAKRDDFLGFVARGQSFEFSL